VDDGGGNGGGNFKVRAGEVGVVVREREMSIKNNTNIAR